MTNKKLSPFTFAPKYGLAFGVVYFAYQIVRIILEAHYLNSIYNLLFLFSLLILAICTAIYQFRKNNDGDLKFLQAIQSGLSVSLTISASIILYIVVLTTVVEPNYYETFSEINRERHIRAHPELTPEEIDADVREGLSSLSSDVEQTLVVYNVGGLLISLIAGGIMRKKGSDI